MDPARRVLGVLIMAAKIACHVIEGRKKGHHLVYFERRCAKVMPYVRRIEGKYDQRDPKPFSRCVQANGQIEIDGNAQRDEYLPDVDKEYR